MNIAVINCSGNVGKTTLTRQLLAPRLQDHVVAMMESINADESGGEGVELVLAREASRIHERMLLGEHLIVDIGASNVEEYLRWLEEAEGAQADYAMFIVPVVPAKKQMQDTIKTIRLLADLFAEPERVRVAFNMVQQQFKEPLERTLRRDFGPILDFHERSGAFELRLGAAIPESGVFAMSAEVGLSVHQISQDRTDYRALIAAEKAGARRNELVRLEGLRRLATGMEPRLQAAFDVLMGEQVVGTELPA